MRSPQSASVWSRLEPLLGKVQKPARYIGCEDGAVAPVQSDSKVSWLLTYPEMYEVGLPNQGLQILYEILNERDVSVAERSYAPYRRRTGSASDGVGWGAVPASRGHRRHRAQRAAYGAMGRTGRRASGVTPGASGRPCANRIGGRMRRDEVHGRITGSVVLWRRVGLGWPAPAGSRSHERRA